MRVAFLLQGMSAYLDASFRALHECGHDILLVHPESMSNAPYDGSAFGSYATVRTFPGEVPPEDVLDTVEAFRPDAVIMAGWHHAVYRQVLRRSAATALRVLFMDNVWNGTAKQWVGRLGSRVYLRPYFDCVFVPGDRQETFARHLGFRPEEIIRGGYTADVQYFDRGVRPAEVIGGHRAFLFAGRLVPQKGLDTLAAAYRAYRATSADPWDLHVAGTGPGATLFDRLPGVHLHGFVQPPDLVELMHSTSCLVFPSVDEHYGVLVHEAAAAGLPLLCTDIAGVAPVMVQDGYNGWVVPSGRPALWAEAMAHLSSLPAGKLAALSAQSRVMSQRLDPPGWARNLDESLSRMRGRRARG